ncbi:30S ribosomal protein S5 [Mariprofundus erugo]|uniref:Small ribosomal subunit protein uS5 n=1 Tax=Mariprofundus erugo TaxID=2528639 RepID=A0A5R9GQS0_9PROT|nr:30S ribosomal protein S5 [Mariprofundus erugo]TLS65534.1 30S ribosomal protein S5 [Mariprofundus erugo]TLS74060.1 30S ribosomal protein S5 [Mariprofundus erugo]
MINANELELNEKLVAINRIAKTVSGGRRMSFSALMIVGDGNGHVGFGHAKAKEVPEAIRKAGEIARKSLIYVPRKEGSIHFQVTGRQDASYVMLKPAALGTGVIANSAVRAVMDAVGISDILTKSLGSRNTVNSVRATFNGLKMLESPEQVAARRGKTA